jgi:hypothetical protein
MFRLYKQITFLATIGVTTVALAQVNAIDVCYSMAQNALHNISVSQTNDASISATFSNYCHADGSTNNSAINASGNAIVNELPIGAAFAGSSASQRWNQFCSLYQTSAAVSNNQYNYANMVLSKGLDSVNDCLHAAANNFGLSYQTITPSTLVINFTIPAGQNLAINGLAADTGVTCTGHDFSSPGGGSITYSQSTQQTVTSVAGTSAITCVRTPAQAVGGNQFYSDKAIVVTTNVGALDIYWPQDSVFPIVTASTIQNNLNALQRQINDNKAEVEFNQLPIGSVIPWYSNAAPPAGWVKCDGSDPAHCPDLTNTFLLGTHSGDIGRTGGSTTTDVPWLGSNNRHGDGNGWSVDGGHFVSNDSRTISIMPPFRTVVFIMKIATS